MALEMRATCERCDKALPLDAEAYVCSYECTFCPACTSSMALTCPNCGGELEKRPRRKTATITPRDVVRRLHEIWSTGDASAAGEVYADDFVAHFPPSGELPERRGIEGVRRGIDRIKTAFPDWREDIDDMVTEGNRVVTRYTSRGMQRGTFWGIAASGRRVELPEISIFRVARGKVVEQWCAFDELTRMQQLGATLTRP